MKWGVFQAISTNLKDVPEWAGKILVKITEGLKWGAEHKEILEVVGVAALGVVSIVLSVDALKKLEKEATKEEYKGWIVYHNEKILVECDEWIAHKNKNTLSNKDKEKLLKYIDSIES